MRIALAGNPNSGKTTLYNALTGQNESVGNWAGVTVEAKEASLRKKYNAGNTSIQIVDLPGAYSISPFTGEEAITRDFILQENPDVIINIVDGANLSRSLFFTTQLLELGVPVVIALNKWDILQKRGDEVNLQALAEGLQSPIIETNATKGTGLEALMQKAINLGFSKKEQETPIFDSQSNDMDKARQQFIDQLVDLTIVQTRDASQVTLSDRIDRVVAHKWLGLPIFFLVMWAVYAFSIEGLGGMLSEYLNESLFGELVPNTLNAFFEGVSVHPLLQGLIVDGAVAGAGAVIGFLPLIMVLFFMLSLLEDSGYMARVAVIMDRYFKKIGLSGKSIIPMIVGSGCAIPGVMATRTIEDEHERRITTILTPFVPCGAKLPIIALFSVVFFPESSWVGPSMYLLAIGVIIVGGLLLKRIFVWEGSADFFLELPEYKVPNLKRALFQMIDKAKGFIYKATTIIVVMNTLVWLMQAFSWSLQPVEDQSMSMLASFGTWMQPLFIPMGLIGWQLAAAALTGFIAKENVVATFAILMGLASAEALHLPGGTLTNLFTPVTAYAFLVFNLFTPPCFAAIGAMNSELGSKKWLAKGLAFQLSVGYILAIVIAQVGTLVVEGRPAMGLLPALIILLAYAVLIHSLIKKADDKRKMMNNVLTEEATLWEHS